MILYKDNSNFSTKKILRINKFTQVTGYTINIKKCIAFFYTLIMNYQKEMKKIIQMKIAWNRIEFLEINLTKKVKTYSLNIIKLWWGSLRWNKEIAQYLKFMNWKNYC